jgi:Ala-tRNA(Pro) deacylase
MDVYHPTVNKIKKLLDTHGCQYKCFEHASVRTSEEASALRPEYTLKQGAKALIVRLTLKGVTQDREKQFVQIVVPGDSKFDVKKAKEVLNAKDIRFATPEEVADITHGILPGGVPPFGSIFGIEVYVDKTLLENEEIIFNAGDRGFSISMLSADYVQIVKPIVVSIV